MTFSSNRRKVLKGMGTVIALPFLEYFYPNDKALAAPGAKRTIFCYIGNGAQWQPSTVGTGFTLPQPLSALAGLRDYTTVVSGLRLGPAYADRGGDHARCMVAFLTGRTPEFPGPTNLTRSLDLMISDVNGVGLKYPNLCLAADRHSESDTGYAAVFTNHISWLGGNNANTQDVDAGALFDRMFSAGGVMTGEKASLQAGGKSVIDFVMGEAKSLQNELGTGDKARLDDYLTSIRELELRLGTPSATQMATCSNLTRPSSQASYEQNVGLMYDILFQALRCGLTTTATLVAASETSNQGYPFLGVNDSHHTVSHDSSPAGYQKLAQIVGWHIGKLAAFCQKLKDSVEGDSNILQNTLVVFGGGMGDGSQHNHVNVPVLLVGRAGGAIPGGRHIAANGAPFCNLQLTVANAVGLKLDRFGDSTGMLGLI